MVPILMTHPPILAWEGLYSSKVITYGHALSVFISPSTIIYPIFHSFSPFDTRPTSSSQVSSHWLGAQGFKGAEEICKESFQESMVTRKSKKCIHMWKNKVSMVTGKDMPLESITCFRGKKLVGHFCGKFICPSSLSKWLDSNWNRVLGYTSIFHVLV